MFSWIFGMETNEKFLNQLANNFGPVILILCITLFLTKLKQ